MENQTDIQLLQIKEQTELLAQQANKIQNRIGVSERMYIVEIRLNPLIIFTTYIKRFLENIYFL